MNANIEVFLTNQCISNFSMIVKILTAKWYQDVQNKMLQHKIECKERFCFPLILQGLYKWYKMIAVNDAYKQGKFA